MLTATACIARPSKAPTHLGELATAIAPSPFPLPLTAWARMSAPSPNSRTARGQAATVARAHFASWESHPRAPASTKGGPDPSPPSPAASPAPFSHSPSTRKPQPPLQPRSTEARRTAARSVVPGQPSLSFLIRGETPWFPSSPCLQLCNSWPLGPNSCAPTSFTLPAMATTASVAWSALN